VKVLRTALAEGSGEPGALFDRGGTIACGGGAVRLLMLQRAGKGAMPAEDFLRGARLEPGARLG
jgi:methionyl-tRNA formyltransferase